jgi:hypothetical protein
VERELANYRRFGELCSELVAVNEQLCRLRPVAEISNEQELAQLKKNLAAEVQQEVAPEILIAFSLYSVTTCRPSRMIFFRTFVNLRRA